jgi:flavin reductase (DIM6/NTAB) family NADH-FMN oxidoreductase RutF
LATKEAVLNLPSVNEAKAVNLLAKTTGSNPVPPSKILKGYRFEKNKFEIAGLTATPQPKPLMPHGLTSALCKWKLSLWACINWRKTNL